MTVLVTGSTGLIGKALVSSFAADQGTTVLAAARNPGKAGALFSSMSNVRVVEWDVTRPASIPDAVDYIVHAAAETSSMAFVDAPVEVIGTIVDGTRNVLELARLKDARGVVLLSTMEVYGAPTVDPVTERDYGYLDPLSVRSSYPEAKRLAECLAVSYASEYGLPVKIARLTQTFGEGVVRGDRRVFAQFAAAVEARRDIVLHTAGRTARCYCYLGDAVSAIRTILFHGVAGEAYTVANPGTFCTIREMAEMLAGDHPDSHVVIEAEDSAGFGYAPEFRMRLSTSKLEALGWKATVGLREMFDRLLDSWSRDINGSDPVK